MNEFNPEIELLLNKYVELLNTFIGDDLVGVYIYGSLVLGGFNIRNSDIDFVTIIKTDIDNSKLSILNSIHEELNYFSSYASKLEGEYINLNNIKIGSTYHKYPYFAFGKYQGMVNLKNIPFYQLINNGYTLCGENIKNILQTPKWENVQNELSSRLSEYWVQISNKWWLLMLDGWIALIVLNLCRIYYTLENKKVISKCAGGEYLISIVPEEWHKIILEALRIQNNSSNESLFNSRLDRKNVVKKFIKYIEEICNTKFLGLQN